jgi:hypothetical protein
MMRKETTLPTKRMNPDFILVAKTVKFLPVSLDEAKLTAASQNISISEYIRRAVEEKLERDNG